MAKDSFIFHLEYAEELEELSYEEQGMILSAMIRYTAEGVSPDFEDRTLRIVWKTICRRLDADQDLYEAKCQRNAENAKKGGAPKGNQNAKKTTENNPKQPNGCKNNPKQPTGIKKQPKQPDTDTDIDIDTDITTLTSSNNNAHATPPTLEEVEFEIVARGLKVRAETFLAYYKSQGWLKSNGLPVTDWKSELQVWSIREGERKVKSPPKKPSVNNFSEKQDYDMDALRKAAKG